MITFDAEDGATIQLARLPSGYVRITATPTIDPRGVIIDPDSLAGLAAVLAALGTRTGQ